NGRVMRLRTFGPGTIVGEMALYAHLTRSADVVADTPSRVWMLSAGRLAQMERADPALAIQFHTFIVKVLAARLGAADLEIQALRYSWARRRTQRVRARRADLASGPPPAASLYCVCTATLVAPRVTAPASKKSTNTRLFAGSNGTNPVPVTKTENVRGTFV